MITNNNHAMQQRQAKKLVD